MLLQCCKLDDPQFSEIWVLRFTDQHGSHVREIVGPDREEAEALLLRRRDEVRQGTYLSAEDRLRLHEQRWGRPFRPGLREFAFALLAPPRSLAEWQARACLFGPKQQREASAPAEPAPKLVLPAWLTTPPPSRVTLHPRAWRMAD